MSQHRRHADDFTDSLNSFRYTSSSDIQSDTLYSLSEDSLDQVKTRNIQKLNDVTRNSKHSIILAGSSSRTSSMLNTSASFVASMEPAPDLNKRIDLFQNENLEEQYQCYVGSTHLCKKTDDNKENNNPQCAMKDQQLESKKLETVRRLKPTTSREEMVPSRNVISESSKRDTNHNFNHNHNSGMMPTPQENVPKPITESQLFSLPGDTNKETHIIDLQDKHEQENDEQKKFESILCFLDNQLNRMKEVSKPQQIFTRLSNKYINSPENFTERLLTIIEESVINIEDNTFGTSAINLSRLTSEFRKMCKFIEDEVPPEWPPSPLSTPPCLEQGLASSVCNKSTYADIRKNEKSLTSSANAASLPSTPLSSTPLVTPLSGTDVIKRRFFQKISKNNCNGSINNVNNLSSNVSSVESFECLEAQCKGLFPEETGYSHPLRKSISEPSLLSMSQIQNICEKQMASLNISNTIGDCQGKTILSSPNLLDKSLYQNLLVNKLELNCAKSQVEIPGCGKSVPYEKVSYSKTKCIKSNKQTDSSKPNGKKATYDYMTYDPDELEKTLLQDIAEKRKRCLDTARLISEINADPEATDGRKSLQISFMSTTDSESNSMSHDEAQFLKTLTSCKDYQTYLEQRKPLFNLLYKPKICSTPKSPLKVNENSDVKYRRIKDSKKELFASSVKKTQSTKSNISTPKPCGRYNSPLLGNKDRKNKENSENTKPKFFVTPDKSPQNTNCKKKKLYFPSPGEKKTQNILKSPHAEGLYRLNYNTIISPVGMYIRGTDMQLIKNVRAKTDVSLLSPAKKNVKATPSRNSKQSTPLKSITKTQKKIPLKINLSPKVGTNQAYNQEVMTSKTPDMYSTPKSHFILPKVSYKLPLQVKTIKDSKSPKPGTRVEKLLAAAESRVIIRHEARVNSIRNTGTVGATGDTETLEINYEPEDVSIHIEQAASKTNFIHKLKNI